ncbi:NEQ062 [Nanoarchaeum equitans Kin4-M]|uniref:NEQ062 n=1 Tax=Nanoarchaeum equitans (strain Kin4-M) TaxID=228908 RepID=Q74MH4_NANEQ|nr:NEQ062 [Nanoarchaeum equitans Kin4-M]
MICNFDVKEKTLNITIKLEKNEYFDCNKLKGPVIGCEYNKKDKTFKVTFKIPYDYFAFYQNKDSIYLLVPYNGLKPSLENASYKILLLDECNYAKLLYAKHSFENTLFNLANLDCKTYYYIKSGYPSIYNYCEKVENGYCYHKLYKIKTPLEQVIQTPPFCVLDNAFKTLYGDFYIKLAPVPIVRSILFALLMGSFIYYVGKRIGNAIGYFIGFGLFTILFILLNALHLPFPIIQALSLYLFFTIFLLGFTRASSILLPAFLLVDTLLPILIRMGDTSYTIIDSSSLFILWIANVITSIITIAKSKHENSLVISALLLVLSIVLGFFTMPKMDNFNYNEIANILQLLSPVWSQKTALLFIFSITMGQLFEELSKSNAALVFYLVLSLVLLYFSASSFIILIATAFLISVLFILYYESFGDKNRFFVSSLLLVGLVSLTNLELSTQYLYAIAGHYLLMASHFIYLIPYLEESWYIPIILLNIIPYVLMFKLSLLVGQGGGLDLLLIIIGALLSVGIYINIKTSVLFLASVLSYFVKYR